VRKSPLTFAIMSKSARIKRVFVNNSDIIAEAQSAEDQWGCLESSRALGLEELLCELPDNAVLLKLLPVSAYSRICTYRTDKKFQITLFGVIFL